MGNTPLVHHEDIEHGLPFAESHAFVIGINRYADFANLNTAVNDAGKIAEVLEEKHGYRVHKLLSDDTSDQATRAGIVELLRSVEITDEDRVLFYFAGHGVAINRDDTPQGYLIPSDGQQGDLSSLIGMDELQDLLQDMPCRHGILILDCCYSGAFKWSARRDAHFIPDVIYQQRFDQYVSDPAWQVITSTADDQKALDSLDALSADQLSRGQEPDGQHSPFAHALFDGLAGAADTTPKTGDGVITANELIVYLRDRVEDDTMANGQRQSPMIHALRRHDKGEYIFLDPNNPDNYRSLPQKPSRNPYQGLAPYPYEDDNFFYGRDRLVSTLKDSLPEHRFIVVSAPSGAGKTSLVQAGLLPELWEEKWRILPIVRPGEQPLQSLEPITETLAQPAGPEVEYDVLFIDDFEDLVTTSPSAAESEQFTRRISEWLYDNPKLRIVIAVRADHESAVPKGGLEKDWESGRIYELSFTRDEMWEAIMKPAEQAVLFFEPPGIVNTLIDRTLKAPGGLPLLSIFLSRMYESEPDRDVNRALRVAAFAEGEETEWPEDADFDNLLVHKLHSYADRCYEALDAGERACFGQLLSRLVTVKEMEAIEGDEIFVAYRLQSKSATWKDLEFADEQRTDCVRRLAQKLVEMRLLTTAATHPERWLDNHDAYLQLATSDLLNWPRLEQAVKEIGEERLYRVGQLWDAVTEYEVQGRSMQYLWNNNPRLTDLAVVFSDAESKKDWRHRLPWHWESFDNLLGQNAYAFNRSENDFLKASIKEKAKRSKRLWAIVSIVIVALSLLTIFAFVMRSQAIEQKEIAVENERIAIENKEEAIRNANIALNRLGEIYYEEYSDIKRQAITYQSLKRKNYACAAFREYYEKISAPDFPVKFVVDPSGNTIDIPRLRSMVENDMAELECPTN